jgi:aminoglycoside N3'-acetyltransferase
MSSAAFREMLSALAISPGQHLLIHSSFKALQKAFPQLNAGDFIKILQEKVSSEGSLLMPVFTYCFRRSVGDFERFSRDHSPSKTGWLTEYFRRQPGVLRSASPTHSFALWGKITAQYDADIIPQSPLGKDSPLEWLAQKMNGAVLMLGTDFHSLSFGHYLEILHQVPWADVNPWTFMHVEKIGAAEYADIPLRELPGCSQSFLNFEKYIQNHLTLPEYIRNDQRFRKVTIPELLHYGEYFFSLHTNELLCPAGSCQPCDTRRKKTYRRL